MSDKSSGKQRKSDRKAFPFYPLLFGIYPILALTGINIAQVDFTLTYRAFVFSLLLAGVLFIVTRLILRNWASAAFLTLLWLMLFYSYGQVYNLLKSASLLGLTVGRHRILGPVWVAFAGLAVWASTRQAIRRAAVAYWLNILSALLLIFPAYEIVRYQLASGVGRPAASAPVASGTVPQTGKAYPDIYYIVLDAYMRSDNIKAIYGYDNSAFLAALAQRGFYVADCSQSNYAYTELSLASSLNFSYLDQVGGTNDYEVNQLMQSNAARKFLKSQGYTTVSFETGFFWSEWKNAEDYFPFKLNNFLFNEFELLFLQTTLARIPMDYSTQARVLSPAAIHHDRTIYNLNLLQNMAGKVKSPKFVFAHLIIPHPSYVFGPNGEYVVDNNGLFGLETDSPLVDTTDLTGYPDAVNFIDKKILAVVDQIIAGSRTPPVIVIQGDHGSFRYNTPAQRMSILNAYYLPGGRPSVYPAITPVNTFRIIFDTYLGQSLPLLKDQSWFSKNDARYNYELIPNQCGH